MFYLQCPRAVYALCSIHQLCMNTGRTLWDGPAIATLTASEAVPTIPKQDYGASRRLVPGYKKV